MNKSFNVAYNEPKAFITVRKQRQKQHGKNIYLHDNTEFEIELHNPTNDSIKATIEFNGKQISSTGIVLKPGQRVFLERYLDVDRKFLFETYEVNNTQENREAIEENGLITVRFFKKYYNYQYFTNTYFNTNTKPNFYYGDFTFPSVSNTLGLTNSQSEAKSLETGRVEMGDVSNQKFGTSYEKFEVFHSWVSEWKLLPFSTKDITSEDLTKKCAECGTKIRSNFKFCPHCGEKVNKRNKTEIIYTDGITFDYMDRFYVLQKFDLPLNEFLEIHKNKLIVINPKYLLPDSLRAVVITE